MSLDLTDADTRVYTFVGGVGFLAGGLANGNYGTRMTSFSEGAGLAIAVGVACIAWALYREYQFRQRQAAPYRSTKVIGDGKKHGSRPGAVLISQSK